MNTISKRNKINDIYKLINLLIYSNNIVQRNNNIMKLTNSISYKRPIYIEHFREIKPRLLTAKKNEKSEKNEKQFMSLIVKNNKIGIFSYPKCCNRIKILSRSKSDFSSIQNKHFILAPKSRNQNLLFKNNISKYADNKGKLKIKSYKNIFKKRNFEYLQSKSRYNDMNLLNRFRSIRKELFIETNKINEMKSQFFKNDLYIKYNNNDRIADLKERNLKKRRPNSSI